MQEVETPELVLWIVLAAIPMLAIGWLIGTYNALIRIRQQVRESWSGIDTELKRRYDLIPNLVETVKAYASHEQSTLKMVVDARNRAIASTGSPAAQAQDENVLVASMRQLFALAEGYPDLKANQNYMDLQRELANTENRIQGARRFYNANVRDLNTRIEVFPSNLVASAFNFKPAEFFEIDNTAQREAPVVRS